MSVMLYPCIFCVALLMDLFVYLLCCVFDSVCELFGETIRNKQFAICLGVVILLLNVMEVFSVGGVALLDIMCMVFHNVRVVPVIPVCSFHRFCLCLCMSEVISSCKSLRAGSQVFALIMLFL